MELRTEDTNMATSTPSTANLVSCARTTVPPRGIVPVVLTVPIAAQHAQRS